MLNARGTRERALPGQVHLFRTFFLKAIPVAKTPSVTVKKRVLDDNLIWLSSSQPDTPRLVFLHPQSTIHPRSFCGKRAYIVLEPASAS